MIETKDTATFQAYWMEKYRRMNAFWVHDGKSSRPHVLLTSTAGEPLHSNGYFNSALVTACELTLREAVADLFSLMEEVGVDMRSIDTVVGPQSGATKMAECLSDQVYALTGTVCLSASPAKHHDGDKKFMTLAPNDIVRVHNRKCLLCEDVVSTGGTVGLTAEAVVRVEGEVLPYVVCLVNRSGKPEIDGRRIISLIERTMMTWPDKERCFYCSMGSKAIAPKLPGNWERLNAE
ncbi:MAG: phosphoribosyltransferase [Candidatus Paceibacterota bacterium]|jgi:orotate phosphoribosyltransferase